MTTKQETPAVFISRKKVFEADTCKPVVEAVAEGRMKMHALARRGYPGTRLRPRELEGICTFGHWDAKGEQHQGLPYHRNEGIEFTMMLSGAMPISVGEFHGILKPGNMMITRPWQLHKLGDPNFAPGKLAWFIIDVGIRHPHQEWKWPKWIILGKKDLADLTRFLSHNEQCIRPMPQALCDCFAQLCQIPASADAPDQTSKITILANSMLMMLLETCRSSRLRLSPSIASAERTVKLFVERVGEDLRKQWTVGTMAEACGLGITRFTHYFQQITNETPARYLGALRISEAEKMLAGHPDIKLDEISKACGFTRVNHFIFAFRTKHGCTPGKFRAKSAPRSGGK